MASDEMKQALRRLFHHPESRKTVDMTPGCPFGAVVGEHLRELEQNLAEVRSRLNGLIFLVLGAVILEIVLRLLGVG